MYDGKQILRFINNYKTKDLYLIGNEMNKRIGTGNYDSERTKFNVHYKDINKSNLYQEVKSILEDRNIEYSHMYQNKLDTIVNIIELQNSKLNNNVIETKPTILLEDKETLLEPEEESYDYEEYEIVKPKNKDDLVL